MFLACFSLPVAPAMFIFLYHPPGIDSNLIGDNDTWCWIDRNLGDYQLYLWFIPNWTILILNIGSYFVTWLGIVRQMTEFKSMGYRLSLHMNVIPNSCIELMCVLRNNSLEGSLMKYRMNMVNRFMAYTFAFLITWTPTNINRLVYIVNGIDSFVLGVIQDLTNPLRGFINTVVFFYLESMVKDTAVLTSNHKA